jgi:hypothetical protein
VRIARVEHSRVGHSPTVPFHDLSADRSQPAQPDVVELNDRLLAGLHPRAAAGHHAVGHRDDAYQVFRS